MAENMASKVLDQANKLYKIGLKGIKLQMNMLGTDFVVLRPKDNSKWKNVFGGAYSSDNTLENDYEQFTVKLIVNMNDMKDVWNRNQSQVQAFTNDGTLEVGDEIQYTREKRTYRFKVMSKQAFSEVADVWFTYVLSSIVETLTN
jgi:hypothetical protein